MKFLISGLAFFIGFIVLITLASLLFAYPTMWLVNYLFAAQLLTFVFGVAKLSIWQAWALNVITSVLFKSTNNKN